MKVVDHIVIYRDPAVYASFPNLARLPDGSVICAFRHAKDRQSLYGSVTHIDPTAKDVYLLSRDGGKSFQKRLHTIVNDRFSDQDPCVNVLRDGRIIVTYFRWELCALGRGKKKWGSEQFETYGRTLWEQYDCFPGGVAYSISDDLGATWTHHPRLHVKGMSETGGIRGNITELSNGDLLLPFYGSNSTSELDRSGLIVSHDRGESWEYLTTMAFDPECKKNYLEPNIYQTAGGKIVGLYRTQTNFRLPGVSFDSTYLNLHVSESTDGGKTFGPVREIPGLWGSSPFHALRLRDGRVLLSYGYRRKPFGIRARICDPELEHIEDGEELILVDDAPNGDLGYPHAVQLDDGSVLVAYYISGDDRIRRIEAAVLQ